MDALSDVNILGGSRLQHLLTAHGKQRSGLNYFLATQPQLKAVLSVTLVVSTSRWEVPNIWDVRVGSQTWETNGKQTLASCSVNE